MVTKEYSEAFVEVLDILKNTEQDAVNKIPKKLIHFFEENASKEYSIDLDHSQAIENMNLKKETLSLLAMLYRNYWCTEEERKEFDSILAENEAKYQAELREKYNPDNLFKKEITEESTENVQEDNENNLPIEVKEQGFFKKLVNFLKRFFRRS